MNLAEFQEIYDRSEKAAFALWQAVLHMPEIDGLQEFLSKDGLLCAGRVRVHHYHGRGVQKEHFKQANTVEIFHSVDMVHHAYEVWLAGHQFAPVPEGGIIPLYNMVIQEDADTHEVIHVSFEPAGTLPSHSLELVKRP